MVGGGGGGGREKVVSHSQTAFQGKESGTLPMRRLCRDPLELGGNNCILSLRVTRQPPAHNYRCFASRGNEGHDSIGV